MDVKDAINKRYSTRRLDPNQKISDEDIDLILDAGRKAPNGFGLEAWTFIVIDGDKNELSKACNNQRHVLNASHVIALTSLKTSYIDKNKSIITDRLARIGFEDSHQIEKYTNILFKNDVSNLAKEDLGTYNREQNHVAAAFMVLQATELGIGSVIVGGFNNKKVIDVLQIDDSKYKVDLLISLGYSTDVFPKKRIHRHKRETVKKLTL